MDAREATKGLLRTYVMVWEEVNATEELKDLPVELRKDIATSVFIQLLKGGARMG
jgi:hypothetical protein